jgi:chemotaxis protein MotB
VTRSAPAPAAPARRTRRAKRNAAIHEDNHDRWLLTYADMITLLLVLFIVLFALSKIDQSKYKEFQESVSEDRVVGDSAVHSTTKVPPHGPHRLSAATKTDQLNKIEKALSQALAQRGELSDVTLNINSSGLVEGLVADSTFFQVDSAQLSPLGQQIVDTSGQVLARYANAVDIAGYTDDQAITGGPYANNWELSAARATSVVERLTEVDAVAPQRVVALAYGQYHPIAPNATPAGQAQNRRVNIVIKRLASSTDTVSS